MPAVPVPVHSEALDACVVEILGRLESAKSPVMMVGVEVRRYGLEAKVAAISRRLGLKVVKSFMGQGLLSQEDVDLVGTYMGAACFPEVSLLVEGSDCPFLVGVITCENNFALSEKKIDLRKTIQALNGQVNIGYHVYDNLPLHDVVTRMLEYLPGPDKEHISTSEQRQKIPFGLQADSKPIIPVDIATAVNDLLANRQSTAIPPMLMASDMGDCIFTALEIDQKGIELVAPGYYATMGFAVPAGLGLQAATEKRPLILVGDGAFQMTGWELGNCQRYGWDPIVLLFNNSGWGMLRAFQPGSAFNDLSPSWKFAEMAANMGGDGVRVETRAELKAALDRAVATRGRFQLIEITIAKGAISNTLDRFVARLSGRP